jgi:hypothetical protein
MQQTAAWCVCRMYFNRRPRWPAHRSRRESEQAIQVERCGTDKYIKVGWGPFGANHCTQAIANYLDYLGELLACYLPKLCIGH